MESYITLVIFTPDIDGLSQQSLNYIKDINNFYRIYMIILIRQNNIKQSYTFCAHSFDHFYRCHPYLNIYYKYEQTYIIKTIFL